MTVVTHVVTGSNREWVYGHTLHDQQKTTTWQRLKTEAEKARDSLELDSLSEAEKKRFTDLLEKDSKVVRRSESPV